MNTLRNIKKMIEAYNDKIVATIKTGSFSVPATIRFLNEHRPTDRFQKKCVANIIAALKSVGYATLDDGNKYYVFKQVKSA